MFKLCFLKIHFNIVLQNLLILIVYPNCPSLYDEQLFNLKSSFALMYIRITAG
jgi:hypothetical protein